LAQAQLANSNISAQVQLANSSISAQVHLANFNISVQVQLANSNISAHVKLENSISKQGISPPFEEQNSHCGIHDKPKVSHTILDKTPTPKLEAHPLLADRGQLFQCILS
jgi:hypothetical protein